ncbi:D-glycerate dehydrogenase [Evansella sp. AB-P1]|uniref:2-hydroxyacid dehydrogenase n=1 Tax=Evansella sp. AB-P1 TaxID=3037653 RepID=UPI00241C70AB|nr:D-glycerate dehydrogenase [Evansella sp. AB-P1]MDG5787186.1 D-glycerate dehydrogenase [Evansella sp. AB-P1]
MKSKVVIYKPVPLEIRKKMEKTCDIVYFEQLNDTNHSQFINELADTQGLMGSGLPINEELLNHAPNLKVVSNISVGYNNMDLAAIKKRNIIATNTPDVLTETTADTIFGLILTTARRMTELDQLVKSGQWNELIGEELFGLDVHHKKLGIIGMGRIGSAIAKRAHLGFGMDILYNNRSRNEEAEQAYEATYCSLEDLLQQSDFVCLMTPLSAETEHLIGEKELRLMKKTAIFINGSRGKTVDEEALIRALEKKTIWGAGLDVYQKEPVDKENPLLKMPHVVTFPHIGSATYETRFAMAELAAENMVKGLTGEKPPSLIKY